MQTNNNLREFVEAAMNKYADKVAYQCAGQQLTFSDVETKSRQLAHWLQSKFNQGDRIAIQLPNINQYPVIAVAVIRAGMVIVNTNPQYTAREIRHQFKDSGAKAVFLLTNLLPTLESVISETDVVEVVTIEPNDLVEAPKNSYDNPHYSHLYDLLQAQRNQTLNPLDNVNRDDIAVLQYTGGTTGVAKGASLSHLNILSNVEQIHDRIDHVCEENKEVFVCPLPLYHIYAFTTNLIFMFAMGSKNILIPNPSDLDAFVTQIDGESFTGMSGINTLFVGLCHHARFKALDFSGLKLTISGGTTLTSEAAKLWKTVTGSTITEGYGLSETSPVAFLNKPGSEEIGSIGTPVTNTEVDIQDENENSVETGQSGELVIRGPQVMKGYWQRPEATAEAFTQNGYFKTGDVAIKQENGNYKIVDRIKDMILVSGFNVYPNEIEDVLVSHPCVLEAAVVGGPSIKSGEEVLAYVTLCDEIDTAALLDFCKENLTRYKVPKKIKVLDALPKSAVGKILRRELRTN